MSAVLEARDAVMPDLVNRLAQEVAVAQRALAAATQKLSATTRTLEARTQELTEARAAVALLLATLDSTTDGIIAMGHFGRAMHYNTRFVQMWSLSPEQLPTLNESALLALQLAQVRDPGEFLALVGQRKAAPEQEQSSLVRMTDGRVLQCRVMPQRVRGKRVGTVTSYHDVTDRYGSAAG